MFTRNRARTVAACLLMAAAVGCRSTGSRQAMRPSLSSSVDGDAAVVVEDPPAVQAAPTLSYVDRHPLFSRPRDYYENTNTDSRLVKAASATFVGIPAGIFGELRQIVVGTPPQTVR